MNHVYPFSCFYSFQILRIQITITMGSISSLSNYHQAPRHSTLIHFPCWFLCFSFHCFLYFCWNFPAQLPSISQLSLFYHGFFFVWFLALWSHLVCANCCRLFHASSLFSGLFSHSACGLILHL